MTSYSTLDAPIAPDIFPFAMNLLTFNCGDADAMKEQRRSPGLLAGARKDWPLESVDGRCGTEKQVVFFTFRTACGDLLEGIPEHVVRDRVFLDREVALKHAALGAEGLDCVLVIVTLLFDDLVRRGRSRTSLETETLPRHQQAAELQGHVAASRQSGDVPRPLLKHFGTAAYVGADPER